MSRSRSASPVRTIKTSPERQVKTEEKPAILETKPEPKPEMPPLVDFITAKYDKSIVAFINWPMWQGRVVEFAKRYCPEILETGQWDVATLIYFFAKNSFWHHYGSYEVQALVNFYCSPEWNLAFQEVVNRISLIHEKMSEFDKPNGIRWQLCWQRILRHVNQASPLLLVNVDETRKAFYSPRYHSIFDEGDCYGSCVSDLSDIDFAEKDVHRINQQVKFGLMSKPNTIAVTNIVDDILWHNLPALVIAGYKFPEIYSSSVARDLEEVLGNDPSWTFNNDRSVSYKQ